MTDSRLTVLLSCLGLCLLLIAGPAAVQAAPSAEPVRADRGTEVRAADLMPDWVHDRECDEAMGGLAGSCGGINQFCCPVLGFPPCECDPGLLLVAGVCIEPPDPCVADPCGPTCSPECNPSCSQFNLCLCNGDGCGCIGAGNCCAANGNVGCNDSACCEQVCAIDPFCCSTEWDSQCANLANTECTVCNPCIDDPCADGCNAVCDPGCPEYDQCACEGVCGCETAGSCCEANDNAGCDDATCCETICALDGFCCDTRWDSICANAAEETCFGCGLCLEDPCNEDCNPICNPDCPQFDECLCFGGGCGCPVAGNCCEANGTALCEEADCCSAVCDFDPFCCVAEWDNLCVESAVKFCDQCAVDEPACPGDLNQSGAVDVFDLLALLDGWGGCADPAHCPADLTGDGVVDAFDLLALLGNWGACD